MTITPLQFGKLLMGSCNRMRKKFIILTFFVLWTCSISGFCENQYSTEANNEMTNEKSVVTETVKGDNFSKARREIIQEKKERWETIQKKLETIKIGTTRQEIIDELGNPDGMQFVPDNVIQYIVDYGVLGENHSSEAILLIFDDNSKLQDIVHSSYFYGPTPH